MLESSKHASNEIILWLESGCVLLAVGCRRPTVLTPLPLWRHKHVDAARASRCFIAAFGKVAVLAIGASGPCARPERTEIVALLLLRARRIHKRRRYGPVSTEASILPREPAPPSIFGMPRIAPSAFFEKRRCDDAESLFDYAHRPIERRRHMRFRPDDGPLPSSTSIPDHRPWHGKVLKSASVLVGALAVPSSGRAQMSRHQSQRLPP